MLPAVSHALKQSSGIDLIDDTWGGFYSGGSYLIYGRADSGRRLIPVLFAAAAEDGDRSLFLTTEGSSRVRARFVEIGVPVRDGHAVEIQALPEPPGPAPFSDDELSAALDELTAKIESFAPQRVVVDDFMPFVRFLSFARFRNGFVDLLRRVDEKDVTLMLTMAEPANDESRAVIDFMRSQMTGAVHVRSSDADHRSTSTLTFEPSIGHVGSEGERTWDIGRLREARRRPAAYGASSGGVQSDSRNRPSPKSGRWENGSDRSGNASPTDGWPDSEGPGNATKEGHTVSSPGAGHAAIRAVRLGNPPTPAFRRSGPVPSIPLGRTRRQAAHKADTEPAPDERTGRATHGAIRLGRGADGPEYAERTVARDAGPEPERPSFRPVGEGDSEWAGPDTSGRESFRAKLQQHFLNSDVNDTPFLLVAMRMERPTGREARPFDFEFVLDLVTELVRDEDNVHVDLANERMVVLLAGVGEDGSQPFFRSLRHRLMEEAPQQAEYLLQSVSAIVVPNGRPFRSAEEFLSYALDQD